MFALDLLKSWGIPAKLYFVGNSAYVKEKLETRINEMNLNDDVITAYKFISPLIYRQYLIAADVALQLRSYDLGQISGALSDCIVAGIPTVASKGLYEALDSPSYVRTVDQKTTPLLVAEQLAEIYENRALYQSRHLDERKAYLETHNPDFYAKRLFEILTQ